MAEIYRIAVENSPGAACIEGELYLNER